MKQNRIDKARIRRRKLNEDVNNMVKRYDIENQDLETRMATEEDYIYFEKKRKKNKDNYKKFKWLGDVED